MTIELLLNWIVCGFAVGLLARAIVPGRQNLGCLMTVALGIVGSLTGGFLYSYLFPGRTTAFSLETHNWFGWGVSIVGAVIVLLAAVILTPSDD